MTQNTDITIWKRFNEQDKVWEHNHWDYGLLTVDTPPSTWPDQIKNWKKAKWQRTHGKLIADVVQLDKT